MRVTRSSLVNKVDRSDGIKATRLRSIRGRTSNSTSDDKSKYDTTRHRTNASRDKKKSNYSNENAINTGIVGEIKNRSTITNNTRATRNGTYKVKNTNIKSNIRTSTHKKVANGMKINTRHISTKAYTTNRKIKSKVRTRNTSNRSYNSIKNVRDRRYKNVSVDNIELLENKKYIRNKKTLAANKKHNVTNKTKSSTLKSDLRTNTKYTIKNKVSRSVDRELNESDELAIESVASIRSGVRNTKTTVRNVKTTVNVVNTTKNTNSNKNKNTSNIKTRKSYDKIQSNVEKAQVTQRKIKTLKRQKSIQEASRVSSFSKNTVVSAFKKVITALLSKVGAPVGVTVGVIICILLVIFSMFSALIPTMSAPMTKEEHMIAISDKVEELDDSVNREIENQLSRGEREFDEVEFNYSGDEDRQYTNLMDFIILLDVSTNKGLSKCNMLDVENLHKQTYKLKVDETSYTKIETSYKTNTVDGKEVEEVVTEEVVVKVLEIDFTTYNFIEMQDILDFDKRDKELAEIMTKFELGQLYPNLNYAHVGGLSSDEIQEIIANAPTTSATRSELREIGLSLVNYTTYRLGAKSSGDVERPKSLDCSGFVAWVYDRANVTTSLKNGGTAYQWGVTIPITEAELQVGDLGFMQVPNTVSAGSYNHVGMYIGNGKWVECYGGHGVGITRGNSFKYYRKVPVKFEN